MTREVQIGKLKLGGGVPSGGGSGRVESWATTSTAVFSFNCGRKVRAAASASQGEAPSTGWKYS